MEIGNIALTHGGKFHADDVFSSALLKFFNPQIQIVRSFQVPEDFKGIVYDIGFGEFDHHQQNAEVRENGVAYAAFGLLWRAFGKKLLGEEEAVKFDKSFVQPLDEDDNTGCGHPLADVIDTFNPNWDSEAEADSCFAQAVEFAYVILDKKFETIKSVQRAKNVVLEAWKKAENEIVILEQYVPWKRTLAGTNAEFVIYPSQRGGYCAQSVLIKEGGRETKYKFPVEWAGKTKEELHDLTGIKSLSFCHNGRFLITAGTMKDIISACKLTKEIQNKKIFE